MSHRMIKPSLIHCYYQRGPGFLLVWSWPKCVKFLAMPLPTTTTKCVYPHKGWLVHGGTWSWVSPKETLDPRVASDTTRFKKKKKNSSELRLTWIWKLIVSLWGRKNFGPMPATLLFLGVSQNWGSGSRDYRRMDWCSQGQSLNLL